MEYAHKKVQPFFNIALLYQLTSTLNYHIHSTTSLHPKHNTHNPSQQPPLTLHTPFPNQLPINIPSAAIDTPFNRLQSPWAIFSGGNAGSFLTPYDIQIASLHQLRSDAPWNSIWYWGQAMFVQNVCCQLLTFARQLCKLHSMPVFHTCQAQLVSCVAVAASHGYILTHTACCLHSFVFLSVTCNKRLKALEQAVDGCNILQAISPYSSTSIWLLARPATTPNTHCIMVWTQMHTPCVIHARACDTPIFTQSNFTHVYCTNN